MNQSTEKIAEVKVETHELNAGVAQSLYTSTSLSLFTGCLLGALISAWFAWTTQASVVWAVAIWLSPSAARVGGLVGTTRPTEQMAPKSIVPSTLR